MRVAFVGQSGAEAGGAERSLQLLLSHLPKRVHSTVILFGDGPYAEELRGRGFDVEIVEFSRDVLNVPREKLSIAAAVRSLRMIPLLVGAYRRIRPDAVYTNTVKAHLLGTLSARLAGIVAVMHLRDILQGRALIILRLVGFTCTRQRIAISNAVARELALPKTTVVPNPLELSDYDHLPEASAARDRIGLPQHVPLVAIIGRINRWKGHDRFLRIGKLVTERSEAHLVIVGKAMFRDADFEAELRVISGVLGISERVHFVPWLEDPRLAYAAIDVNCNTSRAEPFGRTIIEAAACGVPTVTFNEGGAPEAIDAGVSGQVVPADDEVGFAEAILELLSRDRFEVAAAARLHAKLFDAVLHAERITAILDGLSPSKHEAKSEPETPTHA